ncbi:MAG: biotin--[acetyl-CoA-carboxylase] ligase [Deltaproteobacteria bacterium]|nr:biotin--[acetyl-CoA-carboxylase] ligase [Deltaproteobacteria bacterium]MBW2304769.1 biotin--[acetyl-CoA-carboxylase] ligase [Deltaproteobacteria bacterium]
MKREVHSAGPPDRDFPPSKRCALRPERIQESLRGKLFSVNFVYKKTVDSTNRLAKDLGRRGAPDGTLVLAEQQSAGRGRRGRKWLSQGHANLLFSLGLRPGIPVERAFVLTMVLALSAVDGIREVAGVLPMIKWPNDLYLGGRKLAGILSEFSVKDDRIDYLVLGMGINVNWAPGHNPELSYPATSLLQETRRPIDREELLLCILQYFEKSYPSVTSGDISGFYRRWNELSLVLGREVMIESSGEVYRGTALGIDDKGALLLREPGGGERRILAGDVSLRLAGARCNLEEHP